MVLKHGQNLRTCMPVPSELLSWCALIEGYILQAQSTWEGKPCSNFGFFELIHHIRQPCER